MGTLAVSSIVTRAARTLNDPQHATWPALELVEYLSDGQRAAVQFRPEVNPITESVQLVGGSKQEIPASGYVLIDVVRNMGADGATPGEAINMVDKYYLDRWKKDWHTAGPSFTTKHYVYDVRNRKTYYVTPPQPDENPAQVEIAYAQIPAELANTEEAVIEIDDIYQPALLAYVLHRAKIKDNSAEGQGVAQAGAYFTQFLQALGVRDAADERLHPTQDMLKERQEQGY